jgi:hypothetical protein
VSPMNKSRRATTISEILQRVSEETSFNARVKILRDNDFPSLRQYLFLAYNEDVYYPIAGDMPEYQPSRCPEGFTDSNLFYELKHAHRFGRLHSVDNVAGINPVVTKRQRELMIQVLESLSATEIDLFVGMMKKNVPYKFVTQKLVESAFPGLLQSTEFLTPYHARS